VARCVFKFLRPFRAALIQKTEFGMFEINHDIESPDDFSNLSDAEKRDHIIGTAKKYGKERAKSRLKDRLNVKLAYVDSRENVTFMSALGPSGEFIQFP
jgi:hypothetical protein